LFYFYTIYIYLIVYFYKEASIAPILFIYSKLIKKVKIKKTDSDNKKFKIQETL